MIGKKVDREVNLDIMAICPGGSITESDDARYNIERIDGIDGFFGVSSTERFAAEKGITAQTEAFKEIKK